MVASGAAARHGVPANQPHLLARLKAGISSVLVHDSTNLSRLASHVVDAVAALVLEHTGADVSEAEQDALAAQVTGITSVDAQVYQIIHGRLVGLIARDAAAEGGGLEASSSLSAGSSEGLPPGLGNFAEEVAKLRANVRSFTEQHYHLMEPFYASVATRVLHNVTSPSPSPNSTA